MRPEAEAILAAMGLAQGLLAADSGADLVTSKGGRDLVTSADFAVEDAMRAELLRRYPEYPAVGEERGGERAANGRPYWLLDPICGTRAFASGIPLFSVNLALVEADQVVLGAIAEGATGPIHLAERGGGAWRHAADKSVPLHPSDANPVLWINASGTQAGEWRRHAARFISAAMQADDWYVWMQASSLPYAYLAGGRISAFVHFGVSSPVHVAAGCLLASEAGAIVSDLAGRPWSLQSAGFVVAATSFLHDRLLRLAHETSGKNRA